MFPHERSLVKKLEDQPFSLIGVNSDPIETYRKGVVEHGITWRSFMAGSTRGEIPTRWNVRGWPTIYILDHKGVIRYRDLRGEAMEEAVMKLLEEAATDASN